MAQLQWRSLLARTVRANHAAYVVALLGDARVDAGARNGEALQAAAASGNSEALGHLLALEEVDPAAIRNVSLLGLAARSGRSDVVSCLLEDGRACRHSDIAAGVAAALAAGHHAIADTLLSRLPVAVRTVLSAAAANESSAVRLAFGGGAVDAELTPLACAALRVAAASGSLDTFVWLYDALVSTALKNGRGAVWAAVDAHDTIAAVAEAGIAAAAAGQARVAVHVQDPAARYAGARRSPLTDVTRGVADVSRRGMLLEAVRAGDVPLLTTLDKACKVMLVALTTSYGEWRTPDGPSAEDGDWRYREDFAWGDGPQVSMQAGPDIDDALPPPLSLRDVYDADIEALVLAAAAAGRHDTVDWLIATASRIAEEVQAESERDAASEHDRTREAHSRLCLLSLTIVAAAVYGYARAGDVERASSLRGRWPRGVLSATRMLATAEASGHLEAGNVAAAQAVAAGAPVDWLGACFRRPGCSVPSPEVAAVLSLNEGALALLRSLKPLPVPRGFGLEEAAAARQERLQDIVQAAARVGNAAAVASVLAACPAAVRPMVGFIAADRGNLEVLELLLSACTSGQLPDGVMAAALSGAAVAGRPRLVAHLLQDARVRQKLAAEAATRQVPFPPTTDVRVLDVLLAEPLLTLSYTTIGHAADAGAVDAVLRLLDDERSLPCVRFPHSFEPGSCWLAVLGHPRVLLSRAIPAQHRGSILPAVADAVWRRRRDAVMAWHAAE